MADRIWPGQKVSGHDAAVSRVSRANDLWHTACSCGYVSRAGDRTSAKSDRDAHLRHAVEAGSEVIGGGRQAPSGP